ncbi:hypothetical protein DVH26_18735 [Paenibacillus sp. H1-7]|nr:hypothetical protein DVH26_18735 [Paenibacillus sp. H1-7]
MTGVMMGMFLLAFGYIFFPKYMRHYKTYELFEKVPDNTRFVKVVKMLFGVFLLLIAFLILLNQIGFGRSGG